MKSFKRLMGFTMVELIVVMAILAVLCGVIVPNVFAWLRDSKLKTCNSQAKVVFNTAVTVLQDYQLEGKVENIDSSMRDGNDIFFSKTSNGQYEISVGSNSTSLNNTNTDSAPYKINSKLGSNFGENSVWFVRTEVKNFDNKNTNSITVTSALFADNNTAVCIGRYPVPANQYSNAGGFDTVKGSISTPISGTSDAIYDSTK